MIPSLGPGRAGSVALGIALDRLLGEPPVRPHPVAVFGQAMRGAESRLWADRRRNGVAYTVLGVGLGSATGAAARTISGPTYLAVAGRALDEAAAAVEAALLAGDLDRARELLPTLAGRDPSGLDAGEIARATIESLAENTIDAVVAPALWAVVAGGPGALGYRAINTLDAMVGHRSTRYERFGWASARLDDLANWVPARVGGGLVVLVRPHAAWPIWRAVRRDAPGHPSPNGGVIEAAFAAALGLRLGGASRYGDRVEERPALGDGKPPSTADITAARTLARHVQLALAALLATAEVVARLRAVRRRSNPTSVRAEGERSAVVSPIGRRPPPGGDGTPVPSLVRRRQRRANGGGGATEASTDRDSRRPAP